MRPAARLAALIELLTEVEEGIAAGGAPADNCVSAFFRSRRYAGSKDRRFISDHLYAVLRTRELLLWALVQNQKPPSARNLVLVYGALIAPELLGLFEDEGPYGPEALSAQEHSFLQKFGEMNSADAPDAVTANMPEWAVGGFTARYGDRWREVAASLNKAAPLDLRLNRLKVKKPDAVAVQLEGFHKTKYSPLGLRSENKVALGNLKPYKDGWLEVQDEAAQIASRLVAAKPGMRVLDLCAGAGGKALAVAAEMHNRGHILACDIHKKRLAECEKRAHRAGACIIETRILSEKPLSGDETFLAGEGNFDRVLVDAPCSGSGTWRRSPDQRWRLSEASFAALNDLQLDLIEKGALLTASDGVLLYMTCSLLPQENEAVVKTFLEKHKGWQLVDYRQVWDAVFDKEAPDTDALEPYCLQLSPYHHNMDGFFVALLTQK